MRQHFPELDGLRGLAVLAVVLYHFGVPFAPGGSLGVDVFFVLSGFVVTRALLRGLGEPGWRWRFLVRRFWRLMPAMGALLLAAAVWFWIQGRGIDAAEWSALAGGLAMTYNWAHLFASADRDVIHLWSLAIEWQFYLLAPLLMGLAPRSLLWLIALLAAGSVVLRATLLASDVQAMTVYMLTVTRLEGLLLGMFIGMLSVARLARLPPWAGGLGGAAVLLLMVSVPRWYTDPNTWLVLGPLLATLAGGAVIVCAAASPEVPRVLRWLDTRVLRWLGERSYSIYLWHFFLGVTVMAGGSESFQGLPMLTAQIAVSLLAAVASYEWIEKRWRSGPALAAAPQVKP
ncbi:MAG: acyltransferase [Rubrivivax sp.]|nr:acyltransferase [Rubrivivax sp.]